MTRPIKKARVTRRRKYYGGGKRRGGTTLKKVGGGNKTRQIKRCRGSKKGGGTKRKVGGSGNESPTIKKNLRSYFDIPVKYIIDQTDDARRIGELLGLYDEIGALKARNVLADILGPFGDDKKLKNPMKILWPMIRYRVANFDMNPKMKFNDFIDIFIKNPTQNPTAAQNIKVHLNALAEWNVIEKEGKMTPMPGKKSRSEILNTYDQDFFDTHCRLEKIFFACFWEYNDLKNDNEQFISLIVKAPTIINSRIEFFKSLLSDKSGDLYTIQEDDFFSHLNPTSVKVMPSDSSVDSSGLYGTVNINEKKLGFIRQIKEVEKIEKIDEDNFITTNIRTNKKVKSSNVFQVLGSLDELSLLIKNEEVKEKWHKEINRLSFAFNNNAFETFQKTLDGNSVGVTDRQFIYKLSDGVTIYYDTAKFTLKQNLSKCGNNTNDDPYVLAAFSINNSSTPEIPDFYVLTTHLESGRKSADNELQRITGLNEILEEFQKLIKKNELLPSNIPLIIGMDANTPVYDSFYSSKKGYHRAKKAHADILLDSLEFISNPNDKKWLVSGDKPIDLTFLDGKPEWLVSKPDGSSAIEPRIDTDGPDEDGTVISVNKNRGFGTAQAWKMAADEYHLIDWLCIVNNNSSNNPRKITTTKRAILPTRKDMPNDLKNMLPTGYDDGSLSPQINKTNIIKEIQEGCFGKNYPYYSWFSDHLPLVAGLECNGTSFNIVQNNVLSLWLGFDGFKGPNRPSDAQSTAQATEELAATTDEAAATDEDAAPNISGETGGGGVTRATFETLRGAPPPPVSPKVLADFESLVSNFKKDDVDLSTEAMPARAEEKAKDAIRHFAWIVDGAEKKYEKLATTDEAAATQEALENVRKTFKNAIKNAITNDKKMKEGREKLEDINYDAFLFSIAEEKQKAEELKQLKKAIVDAHAFLEELDMPSIPEQDSI
jgi:hypothetical protein